MTHPWRELEAQMPPEDVEWSRREAARILAEIEAEERREAMAIAQSPELAAAGAA